MYIISLDADTIYSEFGLLNMDHLQEQYQVSTTTRYNRYPKIFIACKWYHTEKLASKSLNILSFGCSTGEECFSLAEYFPLAKILGVDINRDVLDLCNRKNTNQNISFLHSNCNDVNNVGPFDIIFCMSVLCKWTDTENKQNISNIYSFSKFQNTVEELDKILVKGGLLVIYNSNFRFSESSIYHKYGVLHNPEIDESGFVQKFDKNNNLIKRELQKYNECIFIKIVE